MGSSCRLVSSSLVDVKVSKGSNVLLREVTEPRAERMLEWVQPDARLSWTEASREKS